MGVNQYIEQVRTEAYDQQVLAVSTPEGDRADLRRAGEATEKEFETVPQGVDVE